MNSTATYRPRRTCLYMPGANQRALEKARTLNTDTVVFDLEDAVAPKLKEEARLNVVAAVESQSYSHREVVVRINGLDTDWGADDLKAVLDAEPDALLVPKINSADDIFQLSAVMDNDAEESKTKLWVMIETPQAILNIREIAGAAQSTRLSAFVMGINDLAKEMFAQFSPQREAFQYALSVSLMAARANGLLAIDGVYNDINDNDGLMQECRQGKQMGFDGKSVIHPAQLTTTNEVFSPSGAEIAQSRAIVEAFQQPENQNKGAIKVNGKMTERLHLEQAERIIAIAEAVVTR